MISFDFDLKRWVLGIGVDLEAEEAFIEVGPFSVNYRWWSW